MAVSPTSARDGSPSVCRNTAKPAVQDLGDLDAEPLPVPPNFNEANVTDKPAEIRGLGLMGNKTIARIDKNFRCRAESLLSLDRGVNRIIGALRDSGELDNTLVIYTSDNGFFHGEHRIPSGKNRVYEEATRVPLMMRGPGVPKGVTVDELAANTDLAPTIADAADAKPLVKVDGRSLLPLAAHPDRYRGREILLEQYSGLAEAGEPDGNVYVAIRTPRYKYVRNATGEIELYDEVADPYELKNQALNPKFADVATALNKRLRALATCEGGECRLKPKLVLKVKAERKKGRGHNCFKAGSFSAKLPRGTKQEPLAQATFRVGDKTVGIVDDPPFKLDLPPKALRSERKPEIAVDGQLLDGRIRTVHSKYKVCG